jgi:hypothetical protein
MVGTNGSKLQAREQTNREDNRLDEQRTSQTDEN